MEGTVTISLKDYEELKEITEIKDKYIKLAVGYVELFEEIESFLRGEKIAPGLVEKINEVLNEWYG